MANLKQQIKIYKKVPGTLAMTFKDIENFQNELTFSIPAKQEFRRIPMRYVVTMFEVPNTLEGYKKGLWSMDENDKEQVLEYAKNEGLYFEEDGELDEASQETAYSAKKIAEFLRLGRMFQINEIIEKSNRSQKSLLVTVARENVDNLTTKIVDTIEEGLQVSIKGD